MDFWFIIYIIVFISSCAVFYLTGGWIITGVSKISYKFGWREFILAFLVMAFTASLPNFFVGINSALKGVPELSFGDVIGGNLLALTIAGPLALLFSAKREIMAKSRTVQWSLFFVLGSALLPLILVFNGTLDRLDGLILIAFFIAYIFWLFYKKERFMLQEINRPDLEKIDNNLTKKDIFKIIAGLLLIIVASRGIVESATFFAQGFGLSLLLIGVLIVGAGNALPQIYFASTASFTGDNWILLGSIMGSVVIPSTLVLGLVSLISPINVESVDLALVGRGFLVLASFVFFIVLKTGQRMVLWEAFLLFLIYASFLSYVFFIY